MARLAPGPTVLATVVLDGAPGSGASSALEALAEMLGLPAPTRGERLGPHTVGVDELRIRAGTLASVPVVVRLGASPSARFAEGRRRALLSEADAVIVVCPRTPAGLASCLAHVDPLRDERARRRLPAVVLAGWSDVRAALPLAVVDGALAPVLGEARVVEASSLLRVGVVDAFLSARAALGPGLDGASVTCGPADVPRSLDREAARSQVDGRLAAEAVLRWIARAARGGPRAAVAGP